LPYAFQEEIIGVGQLFLFLFVSFVLSLIWRFFFFLL